ncbi:hypothetical protein [Streptomyces nitrosporeus]|nr:hypothetical protein [Streptomyces nitrosporeus]
MAHAAGSAPDDRPARARQRFAQLAEYEREAAAAAGRGGPDAGTAASLHPGAATVEAYAPRTPTRPGLHGRVRIALPARGTGLPDDDAGSPGVLRAVP